MLTRYGFALFLCTLLSNNDVLAEVNNKISGSSPHKITERIESFFSKYPNEKTIVWLPEFHGKSRYSFSIFRDSYNNSKKYADMSDLYYLTKKIDNNLSLYPNKVRNIDVFLKDSNYKFKYKQNLAWKINTTLFIHKKENLYGLNLDKDFLMFKNSLGNFGIEQAVGEYPIFNLKFATLTNNENAELYLHTRHLARSGNFDIVFEYTWFDILHQFDFSLSTKKNNKEIDTAFYATIPLEKNKIQFGLSKIQDMSNMNIFFRIKFDNIFNKKNLSTNLYIESENYIDTAEKLTLRDLRKVNLDNIWKAEMNFN